MITSNGGVTLLSRADERLDLTRRVAACFSDCRQPELVVHDVETLVLQRLYGLALGYEDLNDHEELRRDPALQAVAGRMTPRRGDCAPLAGKSTLNRLELSAAGRDDQKARKIVVDTGRLDRLLVSLCVESFASAPEEVVLDLDATDIPLHGAQEARFFHGYYREYCYMPLLFLIGRHPVLVRLRSAGKDAAAGVEEDLGWLLDRLRAAWPMTRIILRTDSGFCREPILAACERRERVDYVVGIAKNARLTRAMQAEMALALKETAKTGKAARRFGEFRYATLDSWSRKRRVIGKAEALPPTVAAGHRKENHRFIVTSLPARTHPAPELYEEVYCARGEAENRVKEHKLHLFSARCSSNLFGANTLRFYLSTFAMILFRALREALAGTRLAVASAGRIRLRPAQDRSPGPHHRATRLSRHVLRLSRPGPLPPRLGPPQPHLTPRPPAEPPSRRTRVFTPAQYRCIRHPSRPAHPASSSRATYAPATTLPTASPLLQYRRSHGSMRSPG